MIGIRTNRSKSPLASACCPRHRAETVNADVDLKSRGRVDVCRQLPITDSAMPIDTRLTSGPDQPCVRGALLSGRTPTGFLR